MTISTGWQDMFRRGGSKSWAGRFTSRFWATSRDVTGSVSDVAAMGGVPSRAVLSICVPTDTTDDDVAALYRGALDECSRHGVEVVGNRVDPVAEQANGCRSHARLARSKTGARRSSR